MSATEQCTGFESGESASINIDGTLAARGVGNGGSDMDTIYMTADEEYGDGSNERLVSGFRWWMGFDTGAGIIPRSRHDSARDVMTWELPARRLAQGKDMIPRARFLFLLDWRSHGRISLWRWLWGFPTSLYYTPDDGMIWGCLCLCVVRIAC